MLVTSSRISSESRSTLPPEKGMSSGICASGPSLRSRRRIRKTRVRISGDDAEFIPRSFSTVHTGWQAMQKIPLSRVHQSELIDRRILEVVKGGNYILGPECKAFEQELAAYFGVPHVVLASSWTAAVHLLHLAQQMHGQLNVGDEILVPSLTAFPSI